MARESGLWKWLSNARQDLRECVDLRRVEDSIGAGFPDVDGFALMKEQKRDGALWVEEIIPFAFKIELKSEVRPARPATPVRFKVQKRAAQIEFMRKRYTMGESAYFLLQVGEAADRMLYLAPGDCGARLKEGLTESELAVLCATENGMVFDSKAKPARVLEGIYTCFKRRRLP
jgi:hypothetical protein